MQFRHIFFLRFRAHANNDYNNYSKIAEHISETAYNLLISLP